MLTALLGVIFASFSVADDTGDGRGGAGIPGASNETELEYKDTPPADTSTPCVDESLLKKLDKPLRSIVIFDSMDESFAGFYIRLREKDTSCEFKMILEQKNLKITYSPERNLVYLAFTAENVIDKMNEVRSLPFVEYVYPDIVKVPAKSSEKLQIFINLNQNDNVSQKWVIDNGKNRSIYDQPGKLGRILEQTGVELKDYDEDLKAYYAFATSEVIREIAAFPFVIFIEQEGVGSEASYKQSYSPPKDIAFFSENLTEPLENATEQVKNRSEQLLKEEDILKEKAGETSAAPEQQKGGWFSKLISGIIGFFKSLFR